jgi:mannose-1-phosphate guanylyltransferase
MLESVMRQWGRYDVLVDEPKYKAKKITVKPGQRLSLQSHEHRDEYWVIVQGVGDMTLGSDPCNLSTYVVRRGSTVNIVKNRLHRIANTGDEPLVFIETQLGDYTGEDDIVRYQDDYGRA